MNPHGVFHNMLSHEAFSALQFVIMRTYFNKYTNQPRKAKRQRVNELLVSLFNKIILDQVVLNGCIYLFNVYKMSQCSSSLIVVRILKNTYLLTYLLFYKSNIKRALLFDISKTPAMFWHERVLIRLHASHKQLEHSNRIIHLSHVNIFKKGFSVRIVGHDFSDPEHWSTTGMCPQSPPLLPLFEWVHS